MGLLGQYIGNQMSDNPDSFGNVAQTYAQNRLGGGTTTSAPGATSAVPTQSNAYQYEAGAAPTAVPQAQAQPVAGPVAPAPQPMPTPVQQTAPQPQPVAPAAQPQVQPQPAPVATAPQAPVAPTQMAPTSQMAPAVQGPVNPSAPAPAAPPMIAGTPTSDVGLTPTEQAIKQMPPAQAPAPVQQPAPDWSLRLQTVGNDPMKLHAIAADASAPEEIRRAASEKALEHHMNEKKRMEAEGLAKKAFVEGDVRAQNQVMRDIRRDDSEGSYLKAYMFNRFGLHELAKNEQQKLGVNQFGQAILDGGHYTVEKNGQGAVTRAWDAEGKPANDTTLSKINAMATSQGTHQYGFAGGIHIVPTTGEQLMPRTNAVTGQTEFVHMVGPNAGRVYSGNEAVIPQAIPTAAAKATNAANIGIAAAAPRAYNAAGGKFAFENKAPMPRAGGVANPAPLPSQIGATPYAAPAPQGAPQTAPAPQMAPQAAPAPAVNRPTTGAVAPQAQPAAQTRVSPASTAKVAPQPQYQEPGFENETPKGFEDRTKAWGEANKKIVGQESAKQYAAQNVYPIVQDINTALKTATGSGIGAKVDDIAAFFGYSTEGAKAISQLEVLGDTLLKSVPRFEGPQSDRDVASYHAAAGKLADPTVPVATKAAAFKTIVDLNKKYSPDLDWSFGAAKKGTTTPASATGQTKTINGVTYVNDGRGWKVQR
jgi:hypothetical protein